MAKEDKKEDKPIENPVDEDKITDSPGTLPYAHHVGSAQIKPADRGKVKSKALSSMYEQTEGQLLQIREQIELLAKQAQRIKDRITVSEKIYRAKMSFEPLVGKSYFVYQRQNGEYLLSMVAPNEWGAKPPYTFIAKARLQADHTWDILEKDSEL